MKKKLPDNSIPDEVLMNKIFVVRGKKVMLDADLAELYGVPTKRLNEQVRRNIKRFPDDFMFKLNAMEKNELIAQHPHLEKLKFSSSLPLAFTEHGAVMLASVLDSDRAIKVNIQIVRIFNKMREMMLTHKDILLKLEQLEKNVAINNEDISVIYEAVKQLISNPGPPMTRIGFNANK